MIKRPKLRYVSTELSVTAIEDIWLRRATAAAIDAARDVVRAGAVPPMTPVGRLGDVEWGWVVAAVLAAWITTRAEQATNSGVGLEHMIRSINITPDPWDIGAIAAILPELADNEDLDWGRPLGAFTKEEIITFLNDALTLIAKAKTARDRGQSLVTTRAPDVTEKAERPTVDRYAIPGNLSIPPFLRRTAEPEPDADVYDAEVFEAGFSDTFPEEAGE